MENANRSAPDLVTHNRSPDNVPCRIQAHGVLLCLDACGKVVQGSQNVVKAFRIPIDALLERSLSSTLGDAGRELERWFETSGERSAGIARKWEYRDAGYHVALHKNRQGLRILEFEPLDSFSSEEEVVALHSHAQRAREATTASELLKQIVATIQETTGFDRVAAYRFNLDGNALPIGESRCGEGWDAAPVAEIFQQVGLHESHGRLRLIVDTEATPVALFPAMNPVANAPLDLNGVSLCCPSPSVIASLDNLGMRAAMSIPLVVSERLWGLIACGHHSALPVVPAQRMTCEMLGGIASDRLTVFQQREECRSMRGLEEQQAELQRINDELNQFSHVVSHELKTPLVTIKGFLHLVKAAIQEGNVEAGHHAVQRIDNAADRMSELLSGLLELSRIGRVAVPDTEFALHSVVKQAIDICQGALHASGGSVSVVSNLPVVRGDRMRLEEVFVNMIDNAIKFSGGEMPPRIEIGAEAKEGRAAVFVRDAGIGIAEGQTERIFEVFEQVTPDRSGTGVGLALVRKIIEVHGGRVWAESTGLGCGSTFWLEFPVAVPNERGEKRHDYREATPDFIGRR